MKDEPKIPPAPDIATAPEQERYQRGLAVADVLGGPAAKNVFNSLSETNPALVHYIVAWALGDIYTRPALPPRDRQLITLGILMTLGGCEKQLAFHIQAALNVGLTKEEITETFLHGAIYAGIPRAMNATLAAKEVFAQYSS